MILFKYPKLRNSLSIGEPLELLRNARLQSSKATYNCCCYSTKRGEFEFHIHNQSKLFVWQAPFRLDVVITWCNLPACSSPIAVCAFICECVYFGTAPGEFRIQTSDVPTRLFRIQHETQGIRAPISHYRRSILRDCRPCRVVADACGIGSLLACAFP